MVVFEDGLARKSEYRRFVIKGVDGQNDVASMHEVITRRFRRLLDERVETGEFARRSPTTTAAGRCWSTPTPAGRRSSPTRPGLVVVDGGPPQVAAAQRALDELGIDDVPVCGLAKRLEEVWLPGQEDPVILPRTSEGLYLLQRVRDEAHRFAITHHRSRRSKIDGREPARRRARASARCAARRLLKQFGSLKKLAGCHRRRDRGGARASGRAPPRRSRMRSRPQPSGRTAVSVNTATGEIEES